VSSLWEYAEMMLDFLTADSPRKTTLASSGTLFVLSYKRSPQTSKFEGMLLSSAEKSLQWTANATNGDDVLQSRADSGREIF
jgi:hypothetical protein